MAQLISLAFIGLFVASVALQVLTFRKERAVKPWRIAVGQSAALVSMVIFSIITLRPPGPLWWLLLLSLGAGGGVVYGSFVKIRSTSAGVLMSYTLPWLITWGALMALTQLTAVFARSVPVFIYALAILNLGINIGMNGHVLVRYRNAATAAAAVIVAALLFGAPGRAVAVEPDVTLDRVMEGEVDGLSVEVVGKGGHVGKVIEARFTNEAGETFLVYVPVGMKLAPANEKVQTMLTAGNELFEVGPGESAFDIAGFCGESSDSGPGTEDVFSYGGEVDGELLATLQNISREATYTGTAQNAVWHLTDDYSIESNPEAQDLIRYSPTDLAPPDEPERIEPEPGQEPIAGDGTIPPLNPIQGTAAIALSSMVLAAGSLVSSLTGFSPEAISETFSDLFGPSSGGAATVTPQQPAGSPPGDDLAGLPTSADGRVYTDVPWDEAGQAWVSAEDARHIRDMQAKGFGWDKRWGWVHNGEAAERQAAVDRNRAQWLATDPELTRINARIREARDAAAYHRRMVETFDQRQALRDRIDAQAAETERLMEDVAAAESQYRKVMAIQIISDVCVTSAANALTVTGLGHIGQGIRAGYNMAKGMGTALGESIAGNFDENGNLTHRFTTSDMVRGVRYGVVNNAIDFTLESGLRKVFGQPSLWKELAPKPGIPAPLLSPNATLRQVVGNVDEIAARDGIEAAVKAVDPKKVLKLYQEGGMEKLAALEALGKISKSEAAVLNRVLGEHVEGGIKEGVADATKAWNAAKNGVRLERTIVGDSGSSAAGALGKTRSVLTDFDRTVVPVFNADDVARYAAERGMTPQAAYRELSEQFTSTCTENVGKRLPGGLKMTDADVKLYNGMGETAGPKDAYPVGFTRVRQSVQGSGTVVRPDGTTYRTSGQAVLDEADLMQHGLGGRVPFEQARIPAGELAKVADQQVAALAKSGDAKSVAKALDRLLYATGRSEVAATGVTANPHLAELARQVMREPQAGTTALLARNGYTPAQFATAVAEEGGRLADAVKRATGH